MHLSAFITLSNESGESPESGMMCSRQGYKDQKRSGDYTVTGVKV